MFLKKSGGSDKIDIGFGIRFQDIFGGFKIGLIFQFCHLYNVNKSVA